MFMFPSLFEILIPDFQLCGEVKGITHYIKKENTD